MSLSGYEAVGIYANILTLILVTSLVTLSKRLVAAEHSADKLFLYMCMPVAVDAVMGILYQVIRITKPSFAQSALVLVITVAALCVSMVLVQWILYVDFKLNGSRDHLIRRYRLLSVPLGYVAALLVLNLFTGFLFSFDERLEIVVSPWYYSIVIINVLLFLFSCFVFVYYRNKNGRGRLFSIAPVMLPVLTGVAGEMVIFFSVEALGFAVALIFLYFSLIESWRYEAEHAGMYNKTYLTRLADEIATGQNDIKSAIVIEAENPMGSKFIELLQHELPMDADLVQVSEKKIVFFTSKKAKKALKAMCVILEDAGAEYDEQHPDAPLHITCPCIVWDGADAQTWVEEVCS